MIQRTPVAEKKDQNDDKIARWGRSRHEGYKNFRHNYLQPAPLFFTQDHHPIFLADIYRGRSAFLIASGPSFAALDHEPLRSPGVMTMGLNNSVKTFRPNMWCCVDCPDHWIRSTWLDPRIQKFVPIDHANKKIFNSDAWRFMPMTVGDCPNVVYYKRNERFKADQFLYEDCFNWGNHKDFGGGRSVLLPAIRILFVLGFRKVYLLGVDLNMTPEKTYHFDQRRHMGSVAGNNDTYQKLQNWFTELRPHFEKHDFHVFNCNPESNLKAFDFVSYKDALEEVSAQMDFVDVANERTRNLYDTETREKEEGTGKELTWVRLNSPKGLKKCRYCGKRCAKPSGDERYPDQVNLTLGCEQSRKALWKRNGSVYTGQLDAISTGLLPEVLAVEEHNKRFGK